MVQLVMGQHIIVTPTNQGSRTERPTLRCNILPPLYGVEDLNCDPTAASASVMLKGLFRGAVFYRQCLYLGPNEQRFELLG